ncbi:hypothetical protein VTK73DRAFT_4192 [Phialemonium thermophilum]|uniref:Uncharacterized protein n=1 Tax=Phialemonium thermophilum TaxID=223376 RepID=A0ABR3VAX1_9PEZI
MDKEIPDALRVSLMVKVRPDGADGPDNDLSKLAETEEEAFTYLTLKWVINSYSWNDVVALVWIGADYSPSRATAVYRPFVEGGYLQIDKMIGCEDWVLSRLLEISRMEEDRQRRREQPGIGRGRGGNEDDDDLTAKAADLDHQLNARLRYHTTRRNRLSSDRERDVAYISEMWIHTALVYLHVVTAGPRSSHPRLRHYVASGLHAYVRLPRHDDIHTALPFAVLASMACGEEEQAEFWRVATSPRSLGEINPGQRKTLAIVKECWRLRELMESSSPDGGVFWRDGAKSLGQVVFPV